MWDNKKSIKLSLALTYLFLVLLIIGIFALPALVTWYVEIKQRAASLPTTIMLTCYPCVPFAATALWSLKSILKSALKNDFFTEQTVKNMSRISICFFIITAVMLFSGRFYLPFYVCAVCTAFIGLIIRVFKNLLSEKIFEEQPQKAEENK